MTVTRGSRAGGVAKRDAALVGALGSIADVGDRGVYATTDKGTTYA